MKTEDAFEHVRRLGRAHAKLTWLRRLLKETQVQIEACEKSIAEMEKHSAEAHASLVPLDGEADTMVKAPS